MVLTINREKKLLIATISLGFDSSLKFQVEFPLSEIKRLLDGEKEELFATSMSEDEASDIQDWNHWGEDL